MDKIQAIAHIHTDFPEKFGIPRQSGLVEDLEGRIVFEPEFRNPGRGPGAGAVQPCLASVEIFGK